MDETDRINHNNSTLENTGAGGQRPPEVFEPYVSADVIASFIGESRRNVLRMAREGKLTCYLLSGSERHTYKFKRSDVSKDLEHLRRSSSLTSKVASKHRSLKK